MRAGWLEAPLKAGLVRFLWLWLPILTLLLAGLARAWATGQVDPWDWALPTIWLMAGCGLLLAKRGWPFIVWVGMGAAGTALLFCTIASARPPDRFAAAGLIAIALLAGLGGAWLRARRWLVGAGLLALAALLLWRGPAQPITPSSDRPLLAVITALPLFWNEAGQGGPHDAPIVTLLRTRFTVLPLDDAHALAASGAQRLLLAQPRALSPDQLVAIDQWVRAGGTALVLADPLLRWPSALPLGDRRRAPTVSLIAPLLAHWGFRADHVKGQEIRYLAPDNHLVTLSGVQVFLTGKEDRWVGPNDWIVHRKPIGGGEVLLLGDADLLDDRLWLADPGLADPGLGDPARPLDPRAWSADTPARVVHWLGGAAIAGRHWMRDGRDVTIGLRWALILGTGWAMLGGALLGRKSGTIGIGTNHENKLEKPIKIS